jgi:hypothetical protein
MAPKLAVIVVLPTPPFDEKTDIILAIFSSINSLLQ